MLWLKQLVLFLKIQKDPEKKLQNQIFFKKITFAKYYIFCDDKLSKKRACFYQIF